jgi:hypothetical protein
MSVTAGPNADTLRVPVSQQESPTLVYVLITVLVLAVAVAFGRTVNASFVDLDDALYVFDNPRVLGGPAPGNVKWALTTRHGGFWIPLTWLSLQADALLTPAPP